MGSNSLTYISSELLKPLRNLERLSLADNPGITTIDPAILTNIKSSVDFTGIKLICDCTAATLQKWLKSTNTNILGGVVCIGNLISLVETELPEVENCAITRDEGVKRDSTFVIAIAIACAVACVVIFVICAIACVVCRWRMRGRRKFPPTSPSRRHVYADCKSSSENRAHLYDSRLDTQQDIHRNTRHDVGHDVHYGPHHDMHHDPHHDDSHTSSGRRSDADDSTRTIRTNDSACSHSPDEVCPLKKAWV